MYCINSSKTFTGKLAYIWNKKYLSNSLSINVPVALLLKQFNPLNY